MAGLFDTLMQTTGGILGGITGGGGILSSGQILHGGIIQNVQTKLPANGILSQRLGTLNSRIVAAQSKPSLIEKIQAFAMPTGTPPTFLSPPHKDITFTATNTVPPPSTNVPSQTTFILK